METIPTPNAAQPKSRRRWYQFSLRTPLLFVTLAGCGTAPAPNQSPRDAAQSASLAALVKAAHEAYDAALVEYETLGEPRCDTVYQWSKRWMEAECRQHADSQSRIAALESHLARMKELAKQNEFAHNLTDGGAPPPLQFTKFYLREAEQMLGDAKQESANR